MIPAPLNPPWHPPLDTLPPTLQLLPDIVRRVGPDYSLLLDGGISRGTDILKAMALGAHAVLIGRVWAYALVTAGAIGVAHVIRLLHDELEAAMAFTGCRTLQEAGQLLLYPQTDRRYS